MPFILLNKPANVLCQFTDGDDRQTLADFVDSPGVYSIGRLDLMSEGLLLLSDDGRLKHRIAGPASRIVKTYWVQVEGIAATGQILALKQGVHSKGELLSAVDCHEIAEPRIWPRVPPVRERKHIPTCWLEITLNTGRNRQIRRMTAAVGLPTLRLIRAKTGPWALDELQSGESRTLTNKIARKALESWSGNPA